MTQYNRALGGLPVGRELTDRRAARPAPEHPALRLRQLTKVYREKAVLDAVTLDLFRGELVAVSGENGAGKSTLVRLLAGLARPTSGSIEVVNRTDGGRGTVAATFEDPTLYAALSVRKSLEAISGQRVRDADDPRLHLYGVAQLLKKNGQKLSFGQRRRVTLTAMLYSEADTVVFDDPANGLDDEGVQAFGRQCEMHRRSGQLIVVTGPGAQIADLNPDERYHLSGGRLASWPRAGGMYEVVIDAPGPTLDSEGKAESPGSEAARAARSIRTDASHLAEAVDRLSVEPGSGDGRVVRVRRSDA